MAYDNKANLAYATIAIAPSPALSGTSLTVASGLGALFPSAPFNCVIYPPLNPTTGANRNPLASTAEIVRVTNRTGDVFTIVRAQEGTTAKSIGTNWQIANTASVLSFTQIQDSIIQFISAGSTKASASEVVFSNANGISFGADGQTVTASVSQASQSTQPVAASASNGSFVFSTLGFSDANGVTFGTSAGSIVTASVAAGVAAGSLSAGTSSMALGQVVFSNSNGVSFGLSNSTVTAQHNGLTSQSSQAASASNGSFAFQTIGFSNANGVTFGTSAGSIITASVNTAGGGGVAISAGTESQSTGTIIFSNSNGVTFGLDAGTLTASVNTAGGGSINFSAGATSENLSAVTFNNANGVSFGLTNGVITASVNSAAAPTVASFWQNEAAIRINTIFGLDVSSHRGCNIFVPYDMSLGYVRLMIGVSHGIALPAIVNGINASVQNNSTWAAFLFSQGTGASSSNFNLYASGNHLATMLNSVSAAAGANSSIHSYTQAITLQIAGTSHTNSNSYVVTDNANYQFGSSVILSSYSGSRYLDINFAHSVSAGPYLLLFALSTSTASNSSRITSATVISPNFTGWYGVRNDADFWFTQMGSIQVSSVGTNIGWGVALPIFGSSTLDPIPITSLNPLLSGHRPIVQFGRTA